MNNLKIAVFGCWNNGCDKNSGQKSVSDLIKTNESKYEFMVILGDNYYAKKKTLVDMPHIKIKVKLSNLEEAKNGFECLEQIKLEKKIIMGNHDVEDSMDKSCSVLKAQLKLPWYDVKFPFGYDLYYLYHKEKTNTFETILFIYLDTTLYSNEFENLDKDKNYCYKSVLDKSFNTLKQEQNHFLIQILENMISNDILNINNVILFGHEPLFTFKEKEKDGIKKTSNIVNTELLSILFEFKIKHPNINLNWICADYHIYQNSEIIFEDKKISQLIFGTGGGELENPVSQNISAKDGYKLKILSNIVYDANGINISENYKEMFGINNFGYGEISLEPCAIKHKFIIAEFNENNYSDYIDYKQKYIKYKNKYIQLKIINYK